MRFICIYETENSDWKTRIDFLRLACESRGIPFEPLNANEYDLSGEREWGVDELVYRATRGEKAKLTERWLTGPGCATFYRNPFAMYMDLPATAALLQKTMAQFAIPSIFGLPKNREYLKKCVRMLGGLPIVIKILGGTHGEGIIKIDSIEGLFAISDYFNSLELKNCAMMSFIDHAAQARLIVLNNRVIASHENLVADGDFRSNSAVKDERRRNLKTYPADIESIAIRAVQALELEFGGVDILFDREDRPWLAEVNFPCYFPTTQEMSGVDIAGLMIDHLLTKSA